MRLGHYCPRYLNKNVALSPLWYQVLLAWLMKGYQVSFKENAKCIT